MWAALVLGVAAVHEGRLQGVLLAVIVLTPLAVFEIVAGLPAAAQALERVRQSAARIFEAVDAPDPVVEPGVALSPPAWPATLCVRGLCVRYLVDGPWALDGLDLELSPGRRIAVIGASGAGKSTLAAVLTRLLAYQAGSVTLAGIELADLEGDDVRRIVGLVEQDAHVFDTSLRENLQLARREATEGELRGAPRRARLLDWVETLPLGLDTAVGEHGARLSGGQRQRLAVARALVADFPILVLDEPGEHLDTATADAVTADIVAVTEARSTLLITHRLVGVATMDEVIVLDAGRAR